MNKCGKIYRQAKRQVERRMARQISEGEGINVHIKMKGERIVNTLTHIIISFPLFS